MKLIAYRFIAWLMDLFRVKGHNWNRRAGAVQAGITRRENWRNGLWRRSAFQQVMRNADRMIKESKEAA